MLQRKSLARQKRVTKENSRRKHVVRAAIQTRQGDAVGSSRQVSPLPPRQRLPAPVAAAARVAPPEYPRSDITPAERHAPDAAPMKDGAVFARGEAYGSRKVGVVWVCVVVQRQ